LTSRPVALLASLLIFLPACSPSNGETAAADTAKTAANQIPLWGDYPNERPSCVRGIHLTAWVVGSKKRRADYEALFADTELNTAVIDIKEIEGEVYVPGVKLDGHDVSVTAVRDFKNYLTFLKERGVYTVARMTVFKDQKLPKIKPEWAIHAEPPLAKAKEKGFQASVWVDKNGKAWADPYNPNVWDYNLDIAEKAADLGFQEIQFDYIRFPSDGAVERCRYSKPHSRASSVKALGDFLEAAHKRLSPRGVEISIDVFGLVGSSNDDMGIGQKLIDIVDHVDSLSPMMYPSHYGAGEYGIPSPNAAPYATVLRSISDTRKMLKHKKVVLRPYLQDFSLGVKYTAKHVRDQIEAAYDNGVGEWLLWNPQCRYTKDAFEPKARNKS
jgi:hypothetical protein